MVFLIGMYFSLRSGREQGKLKFSQLTLGPGRDRELEKLVYVSFGEKNNFGGLKLSNVRQKRIEYYANDKEPADHVSHGGLQLMYWSLYRSTCRPTLDQVSVEYRWLHGRYSVEYRSICQLSIDRYVD